MLHPVDDLDPAGTLAAADAVLRRRRQAEVDDLLLVAHWADLHSGDPRRGPGGRRRWCGADRLVQVGGDGTPMVQELCLPELAIARRVHTLSVRAATADVLDLRHRLPLVWSRVETLAAEVWVARKVAVLTRGLTPAAAAVVDAAVADTIGTESPARVLELTAAKVIEVDEAAHRARLEAEARRRYVGLSRTDVHGLRHVIARVTAGDALWVDATLDRVADILMARPDLRPGTPETIGKDEARSVAFGWLARPAELLQLLLESAAESGLDPEPSRALAVPERALDLLRTTDLTRLRPRASVYVHLHQGAVEGTTGGVARVEGVGPMLVTQLRGLLAHTNVTLKPVIDLRERISVSSYEHPETVKERTHLRHGGDAFPHASGTARHVDHDHPTPYRQHGPPGQTGDHNTQPLGRTGHRAKTHLGYSVTQTDHDEYLWRTPHGLHRLVDSTGTHALDADQAAALTSDDPLDRALNRLIHRLRVGTLG